MNRNRNLNSVGLLAFASVCLSTSVLSAQTFDIFWYTIDGGGGYSTAANFELQGTIGQHDAGSTMTGGNFSLTGGFWAGDSDSGIVLGDVNRDGVVDLLDVAPFVNALTSGMYIAEADVNADGVVSLLDVAPFVALLTGN